MTEINVNFDNYCKDCKNFNSSKEEDPCADCLSRIVNIDSDKPVYFQEVEER